MSLKFKANKEEFKKFLKKVSVNNNIEDAVVNITEKGFNFKGISKTKSFYIDINHTSKNEITENDINQLIINNINTFISTMEKVNGDMVEINFDGDLIKFKSDKKKIQLVASTPENINSNAISSVEFNRKEKTYKCSSGEYQLTKMFTLMSSDINALLLDAKDLSVNKFEFEFKPKENQIIVNITNAGDSITTTLTAELPDIETSFKVKFGDDFKKIMEALIKANDEIIFFVDGTNDTGLLIFADNVYYFMPNDNDAEEL